jgi:hypothetical protein
VSIEKDLRAFVGVDAKNQTLKNKEEPSEIRGLDLRAFDGVTLSTHKFT